MRVLVVSHITFPWERGLGQLYRLLEKLGHEPRIVAPPMADGALFEPMKDEFDVVQLPTTGGGAYGIPGPGSFLPVNYKYADWFIEAGRKFDADIVFCRETPVALWALLAGYSLDVPILLDCRENRTAIYRTNWASYDRLPEKIIKNPRLVGAYESLVIPKFDHVFAVSSEVRSWLINTYDIKSSNVSVLRNTPSYRYLAATADARRNASHEPGPPKLVFAGRIHEGRGLQDIIEALALLGERNDVPQFRIIGEGDYLEDLKQRVVAMDLDSVVEFLPFQHPYELPRYLVDCDIGVCSYRLNELAHQTVPGKLFEYMAAGLAIFTSPRGPVREIVEDTRCGVVYEGSEPSAIAEALHGMIHSEETLASMQQNARRAVEETYNWELNRPVLEDVLAKVEAS